MKWNKIFGIIRNIVNNSSLDFNFMLSNINSNLRKENVDMKDKLEEIVLEKLNKGLLDGVVGDDFVAGDYAKVTFRKIIKDGIPQILRFGADSKFFDNKESIRVSGKESVQLFKTMAEKLDFLKKYGWLINDQDVKDYSALFKPKKK